MSRYLLHCHLGDWSNVVLASDDGKDFDRLVSSVWPDRVAAGVAGYVDGSRDPSLAYFGGKYWSAHDVGGGQVVDYFHVLSSSDFMRTWSAPTVVSMAASPDVQQVWSPEWFVDVDGSVHIFVAVVDSESVHTIYELHPTAVDLSTWSDPTFVEGLPANVQDPQVNRKDGQYLMVYKNEALNRVEWATSDSLTSGYVTAGVKQNMLEGGCALALPGGGWRLYADDQSTTGIVWSETSDWTTWTEPVQATHLPLVLIPVGGTEPIDSPLYHGTVIYQDPIPSAGVRLEDGTALRTEDGDRLALEVPA